MNPDAHWAVDVAWLLLLIGIILIIGGMVSLIKQWRSHD